MSVFRAYDIRGVYPTEVNESLSERIGAAFGTFLKRGCDSEVRVAVGRDARVSGPKMQKAFIKGLASTGATVYDIGMVPTPLVYYATVKHGLDGGCAVTASHNPAEYNGFKICLSGAEPLGEERIKALEGIVKAEDFEEGRGSVQELDVIDDYVRELSKSRISRKLKVVIDAGNGVAGLTALKVFRNIGCTVVPLYCEPDGRFPNHMADPLVEETLRDLKQKVVETKADFGIAYDGDGDRTGFVDGQGKHVKNDEAFSLFIKHVAEGAHDLKVVYDVSSSKVVEDSIKACGGKPVICKVGYPFLRKKMKEIGSVLSGEGSGHYFFQDNHGYDDAVYASLVFTRIAAKHGLEGLLAELPKYITSEDTRFDCPDNAKFGVVEKMKEKLRKEGHKMIDIDGVRVETKGGWFLLRASNTSPKIVLRWEAQSAEQFRKIGEFAKKTINEALKQRLD
jgi:phosphomannomutase/phosphoglucomutase